VAIFFSSSLETSSKFQRNWEGKNELWSHHVKINVSFGFKGKVYRISRQIRRSSRVKKEKKAFQTDFGGLTLLTF
jgi:hypothetical protein